MIPEKELKFVFEMFSTGMIVFGKPKPPNVLWRLERYDVPQLIMHNMRVF
jgi:hypothetical protein